MIRIAIVEDEDFFVEELKNYLSEYQKTAREEFDIEVFRDGDGIVSKYKAQYDIILMDIQMKFLDGMSAAEMIRKMDSEVVIIFITNTPQYAIKGYEVGALDYILKPLSYFAFKEKLGRAISAIKRRERKYITVTVKGGGLVRLDTADIHYVESSGHNLIYHTGSGDYVASGTMNAVEEQLKDQDFYRGNKCYLINLAHVEGIQDKCAVVKGELVQLSRPKQNGFMQALTRYWGE